MSGPAGITFRPFDPAHHFPDAAALIRDVNAHDSEPWLPTADNLAHDWAPTSGFEPGRDTVLAFDGDRLVGATIVGWRERTGTIVHNMEVWVRPADRRRGIGTALLRWAEQHAVDSVPAGFGGSPALPHVHNGGTDRDHDAANAFAVEMGYLPIRFGFVMQRDLAEPIPDVPLPDGIEVRPVLEADHRRIWDADVEAFKDHWESAVREESDYRRFFDEPDLDTSLWQVAWAGEEVAGSVLNSIYADENRALGIEAGWLQHVSTRRAYRGRGVAAALIARSLVALRGRGMAVARLGVDGANPTGAVGLYKRHGFTEFRGWIVMRKPFPTGVGVAPRPDALPEGFRAPETAA
ncbi:MAG TPA: GNAT family N-acetyltransferase [Candidatus Limnocylindrales bacterium]|nr:GNAT family N-acetyltransferase [Candidatus Limnocylindrales bacterium]